MSSATSSESATLPNTDRVLVVIGRTRHKMVTAELDESFKRGAKFIELRLDFLAKAADFKRLFPHKHCPWVATLRRPADGGRWGRGEEERQTVLRQAIVSGFDWVDLETDIADQIRRFGKVQRIISYHNMAETPANLEEIYGKMLLQDGDVFKLAVLANTPADLELVLKIQQTAKKPTICFAMGEIGLPTRFTSLKYGAPWIYAAFNKERGIAPGLPATDDFRTTYPVRSINAQTQFYAVVGDPIGHSFSPILHNHMYLRTKTNAFYVPVRVPCDTFPQAIKTLDAIPIHGYSVTIPHKEAAATVATESERFVRTAGAANTLVRRADGSFFAANSDMTAAVESLQAHLKAVATDGPVTELNQLAVLILGAGGVARAIAHGLHNEGVNLTICARDEKKSHRLAEEVRCKSIDWNGRHAVAYDIVINCTPVGMHPNVNESPFHRSALTSGKIVFDTVYTPETTLLVREARDSGCQVITGVDMFVRQAARQFELFTGKTPDLQKMREIMRKALSPLSRALEDEATDAHGPTEPTPPTEPATPTDGAPA